MVVDDDHRQMGEEGLIRLVERPEAAHFRHIGRDDQVHVIERKRQPGIPRHRLHAGDGIEHRRQFAVRDAGRHLGRRVRDAHDLRHRQRR